MTRAWFLLVLAACGDNAARAPDPHCADWHQWGGNAAHTGASCSVGQPLQKILANVEIDPLVADETADANGDLIVHYQAPLIDGDRVAMVKKGGTFTPCVADMNPAMRCRHPEDLYRFASQTWSEVGYAWEGGALAEKWSYDSGWKPPLGEEVVFQPVIAGDRIAIPEAEGAVAYVDMASGAVDRVVRPFEHDDSVYIVGALAEWHGDVFYNAVRFDPATPGALADSWLVEIDTDGRAHKARYVDLVQGTPEKCYGTYFSNGNMVMGTLPMLDASGQVVLPPQFPCGPQVPGFNAAPAIADDGMVYVASASYDNEQYSYVTSVNPGYFDVNWSRSLRDQLHDGCGVDIPYVSSDPMAFPNCTDGAPKGVDYETGLPPAGWVDSGSTSSPVVMPDGRILYGSLSIYNEERGHLFELSRDGKVLGTYDFGWDLTPAVATVGGATRIVLKDNHYGTYTHGQFDQGPYYLTMLDDALEEIWQYQSTDTQSCMRQPDGSVTCKDDHPHGFEWCINAPAIDANGTMYANSEDGNVYAIGADGQMRDHLLLDTALGASYTPVALDREGRVYALNAGHLYVVGASP